ncbi:DUF1929 domain-containing protein [Streptomyces sp. NBC_00257]|uniref:galactose oxidase-like domain-containing protein n=1 Tax=unclassified Streptomyces TaxID=2593676 RepID=UPI002254E3E7|nr:MULTISPECIES: galactose oxidase-like domain-containing protein [unclassified Streptomyces]WTB54510.1 DUF1929 domain-containing protein [Streptomyces sp. NBC_00826]WTH92603.1 DUF1929 domain-containing protein [Streptomyces sp. NBC_00825]WTI01334.1 DUF1929 domain-containing protein [Streptomyces sp. NBC_00822]MCX4866919.1 DUF1929 domain-containing protein [Streptomyces sp. NBC_00906]MCX4898157.1 DUF1929 domain-containing protein [Streptomyces sp. NBC_00892]
MVTRTLEAAVRVRHRGLLHVWLLDEGDDPAVKEVCARLGVHHFSRKGVAHWNRDRGPHRARTKHGNYNAWLDAHGGDYEFFASVDTDHVPLPNCLERMLGYFRDPDIGFVIGPQVYGNYDTFVTKAAESQRFLFHALIQRAGNRYGAPMKYISVDPMNEARWYPTLTTLKDGRVLALSGLDEIGQIVPGKDEIYDPRTKKWRYTGIVRRFPTYPAVFLLGDGKLFYSGSNAGYGPADVGRDPGVWDLATNSFRKIPGLGDADEMETSATVRLPPAQDERFMVIGGGGVGESDRSSAKSRLVDLKDPAPRFRDGAALAEGTRYPGASLLPDDSVLVTGGSNDYRGRGGSNVLQARLYDPGTDSYRRVADPAVGRNYHSGSVLLPDGRVMVFGSDSLYADRANTRPGVFEQRIEIYTPPCLYRSSHPVLTGGPKSLRRGGTGGFTTAPGRAITSAKLIRPSAVTHVTDTDQRSVALGLRRTPGGITVTVPGNRALVPSGWYMLFVTDDRGTPSDGRWVEVP